MIKNNGHRVKKFAGLRFFAFTCIYFGFCFLMLSVFFTRIFFREFDGTIFIGSEKYLGYLGFTGIIGILLIVFGLGFEAYSRIIEKIDDVYVQLNLKNEKLSAGLTALDELGIERLIPLSAFNLEKTLIGNQEIRIIINANEENKSRRFLKELRYAKGNIKIQILLLGKINGINDFILNDLIHLGNGLTEIRILNKTGIENVIILDQRVYVLNRLGFDSDLDYFSVFYKYSEHGIKSEIIFEDLWHDREAVQYSEKEDN